MGPPGYDSLPMGKNADGWLHQDTGHACGLTLHFLVLNGHQVVDAAGQS